MSADTLRRAATALREQAAEAPSGPWEIDDMNDRMIISCGMTPDGFDDDYDDVAEVEDEASAPYIATMHPGVGLALADWLQLEADRLGWLENYATPQAVILARLILGEATS